LNNKATVCERVLREETRNSGDERKRKGDLGQLRRTRVRLSYTASFHTKIGEVHQKGKSNDI